MINIDIKNKEITFQVSKGDYINRFDLINRMDFYNKSSFDMTKLEIGNNKFENKGLLIEREWHVTIPYRIKVNDLYIHSSFKLNVQINDDDVVEPETSENETVDSNDVVIEPETSESETVDSNDVVIESENSESETIDSNDVVIESENSESETVDSNDVVIESENSESETIDSNDDVVESETSESETVDSNDDVVEPENSESETIDSNDDVVESETSESETVDSNDDVVEPETSENETVVAIDDVIEPKNSESEIVEHNDDVTESETVEDNTDLDVLDDKINFTNHKNNDNQVVQKETLNHQETVDGNKINQDVVTNSPTKRNIFIFCAIILVMIFSILFWRSTSLNSIKTNVSQIENQQALIKKELKKKTLTNEELSTLSTNLQKDERMLNQLKSNNFWITQKRTELINQHNAINNTATDKAEKNQ